MDMLKDEKQMMRLMMSMPDMMGGMDGGKGGGMGGGMGGMGGGGKGGGGKGGGGMGGIVIPPAKKKVIKRQQVKSTPLHDAVRKGDEARVRAVLDSGSPDTNSLDGHNYSPIGWAVKLKEDEQSAAIVTVLLQSGARAEGVDEDESPLLDAAAKVGSHSTTVILLLLFGLSNLPTYLPTYRPTFLPAPSARRGSQCAHEGARPDRGGAAGSGRGPAAEGRVHGADRAPPRGGRRARAGSAGAAGPWSRH
jgi:hypothetical protein